MTIYTVILSIIALALILQLLPIPAWLQKSIDELDEMTDDILNSQPDELMFSIALGGVERKTDEHYIFVKKEEDHKTT